MLHRPTLNQLVINPQCRIRYSAARTATLLDYVLAAVPRTEEVTDSRQDLFDRTHTPLVLVGNYSDVGPVDRWVGLNNKTPELLPTCAVLISKDDSKAYRQLLALAVIP